MLCKHEVVGSIPSASTTLRSSSFGWLTPVSRAKSVELGLSAEALAQADWFEIFHRVEISVLGGALLGVGLCCCLRLWIGFL